MCPRKKRKGKGLVQSKGYQMTNKESNLERRRENRHTNVNDPRMKNEEQKVYFRQE